RVVNEDMVTEYAARNNAALDTLVNKHKVDVRRLPDAVLEKLKVLSSEVVLELANKDAQSKKIYQSLDTFTKQVKKWSAISELAYLQVR
ncbi:MAG TPA: ABC transporter substrate-binding protein, partial [Gammaproteobacteria bacterium]|nr:ABC transporter substrate-binding protein [Gammaproteobacteria bacterium]